MDFKPFEDRPYNQQNDGYCSMPTMKEYIDKMFSVIKTIPLNAKILYIGMRFNSSTRWIEYTLFLNKNTKIDIVEAWENNCDILNGVLKGYPNINLINKNIIDYPFQKDEYDLIIWEDGPEHLVSDESDRMIKKITNSSKAFFIAGPDAETSKGVHQNASYGNSFERHLSILDRRYMASFNTNLSILHKSIILWKGYNDEILL
jgi:hypothetical protein